MDFKIRELRTVAQGRKQLLREREAYSQPMQQGFSNEEACRIVGINEKTGRRWRNGRSADRHQKAAPPINTVVPPSGPSRYLREDDRIYIADRLREKEVIRGIHGICERANSLLKTTFKALRRVSLGPSRITKIAAAALVLLQIEYDRTICTITQRLIRYREGLIGRDPGPVGLRPSISTCMHASHTLSCHRSFTSSNLGSLAVGLPTRPLWPARMPLYLRGDAATAIPARVSPASARGAQLLPHTHRSRC